MRWWALWRGVRRVRPLSAPRGRVVRRRARAFSSLASIVPVANGTAGSSQGARSAARRHTAAHRWRGGTQRTRAIGVEKVERLANLLLLLLRERLLGLGGRPFRGGHSRGRAVALTVFGRCRNSYTVGIPAQKTACRGCQSFLQALTKNHSSPRSFRISAFLNMFSARFFSYSDCSSSSSCAARAFCCACCLARAC